MSTSSTTFVDVDCLSSSTACRHRLPANPDPAPAAKYPEVDDDKVVDVDVDNNDDNIDRF